jgi:ribosome biogenesis protein BMS1
VSALVSVTCVYLANMRTTTLCVDLTMVNDPCPLNRKLLENSKRSLSEKDKQLYAPMSDVGEVVYDKDAVYINIKDNRVNFSRKEDMLPDEEGGEVPVATDGPGERMVRQLQNLDETVDTRMGQSELQLFKGSGTSYGHVMNVYIYIYIYIHS